PIQINLNILIFQIPSKKNIIIIAFYLIKMLDIYQDKIKMQQLVSNRN
ncbi:MAG: hypothetical protein ACJAQ1_001000, partial [Flavobacterium sp.]